MPACNDDQLRLIVQSVHIGTTNCYKTNQSVACHSRSRDAAKTASALVRENAPMASCSPRSALLPYRRQRFRVSLDEWTHARWFAEKDSNACMT